MAARQFKDFLVLCQEVSSEPTSLLLHMEVRRLSRGKVLSRAIELGEEIRGFLTL
jgi:hypothetical protein